MGDVQAEIERRRDSGEPVDPSEYVSGIVQEPGYLRRAANGHLLTRASKHGVAGRVIGELDLPSSMSVLRTERTEDPSLWITRLLERRPRPGASR
jgi:hypothetical protein